MASFFIHFLAKGGVFVEQIKRSWTLDDDLFCVFTEEPVCDPQEDIEEIRAFCAMQRLEDKY